LGLPVDLKTESPLGLFILRRRCLRSIFKLGLLGKTGCHLVISSLSLKLASRRKARWIGFFLERSYSRVATQKRGKPSGTLPLLCMSILVARFVLAVLRLAERVIGRPLRAGRLGRLPCPSR